MSANRIFTERFSSDGGIPKCKAIRYAIYGMAAEITDDTSMVVKSICAKLEREIASAAIKIPIAPSIPSSSVQSKRNPVGK